MKRALSVLIFLILGAPATATPLSDAGYLRKLSYHLRGLRPEPAEYAELARAQADHATDEFFTRKVTEYNASPYAADRMVFRLAERFQVRTPVMSQSTLEQNQSLRTYAPNLGPDALTDLFARLVRQNLSWDTLLTGKRYRAFPYEGADDDRATDVSFLDVLKPGLGDDVAAAGRGGFDVTFDDDDARVAGALTTARFVNRYTTTNVNKNRRRAAAVFRIFLCDPMFPVIPPPPDRKGSGIAQAFADQVHAGDTVTEKQLIDAFTVTDEQRHGADKRCVACHYKLDPMGKTFQAFGLALGPAPTPGALRFAGLGGRAVNERLRGIGDLGPKLARQPEYVRCQVNWFWKQFIGADVPLTPERLEDLSQRFDAVGRRTNDFIRVLVTAPEFRERPQIKDEVTFARVSPYLQRCDSCHAAVNNLPMFSAGHIPPAILAKMKFKVNLPAEDAGRMPLDWASWDPKELELVKQWINQAGAP